MKYNCVVIGLGVGERHLKNLVTQNSVKIVGICDFDRNKLNNIKKKYCKYFDNSCIFTTNYKKLLKIDNLNLAVIASYDNFHCKQILDFSKRKANIFVEKPLCQNISELRKIQNAIAKNKILLETNFVLRENPIFKKLNTTINKRKFGKIYHFEAEYNYGRIEKLHDGWRGKIPFYSIHQGGTIHLLDLILFLKNTAVKKIYSLGNRISSQKTKFKYNDLGLVIIKFVDDSTAKITSNFSSITPHHHKLSVFGTKKTFEYSFFNNIYYSSKDNQKRKIKILKNSKKYDKSLVLKKFLRNIKNNKSQIKLNMKKIIYLSQIIFKIDRHDKKNK